MVRAFSGKLLLVLSIVGFSVFPNLVLAKDKTNGKNQEQPIVWLNGAEVGDLLSEGAFWCMEPNGDTCTFSAEVTRAQGNEFSYRVISFWEPDTLIDEVLDAEVGDDGILCEPNVANLKRIKVTDLHGLPVDAEMLDSVRTEIRGYSEQNSAELTCFAYTRDGSSNPNYLVQYFVSDSGEFIDPIEFLVDYSVNAAANYTLRWEE